MKILLLGTFWFMCQITAAQSCFQVVSWPTGDALIGATAVARNDSGEVQQLVSDKDGTFRTGLDFPLKVRVRYVGHEDTTVHIAKPNEVIRIKEVYSSLEDVVVTGQYQPQSAKNAVYNVRSIGSERIAMQNANSIQEALSNELNVQINRDNATGRSGISMQGLSGQYTKILLDGVPLVGRGGIDNDIDLAQVDIQQVDRIEIVEGPMAVNYGADALAGVINIITKKDIPSRFQFAVTTQTETAGSEYAFFDEGIYSPSATLGYRFNEQWFSQLSTRYYRFGGWQGNEEGREKQWHPKEQWFGGFLTRFTKGDWEIYYRLDWLDEKITNLGDLISPNNNTESFAFDEEYHANRFIHQLQSDWKLGGKANLNSIITYTDYERFSKNFRRFPFSGVGIPLTNGNDTIYYQTYFTRQTLNNLSLASNVNLQLGLEATHERAGGSTLSDGEKSISEVAGFLSSELVFDQLKVRPGIRYTYNSQFTSIPTPSINFSFEVSKQIQLRWSYGRGFRAPSVRELHHEFIDSNHNLVGNQELRPERSHNFNLSVDHSFQKLPITAEVGGFYNDVDQLIGISISEDGREHSYINISEFRSLGGNLRLRYKKANFDATLGFSQIGRLQRLRNRAEVPDFVYATGFIARASYQWAAPAISIALFYKYTGPLRAYQTDSETSEIREVEQDGFQNLDLNFGKKIGPLDLGLGVRNALDITNINNTASGGVHGGGNSVPIGFGRSFFVRLNYQLKTK